mmetsp:Transcript_30442/g.60471  ORF Transcript_30442/g.60471 Transcript_30442/m.60471 type:complete len:144 (+) Transcript_30442:368-799(+)|eukprot:CAMPEP_0182459696 /NCGR_PEP_ID=MMETSP1319-20130603/4762_1 /TAXON_ID=172717 /ORGANISM="Bolidomonas pacifica, Strain RCC208" /LENGTH=143 /DNA_ID=CAMNT_0024658663 /DNA_START=351 /DNA_END=782 /DNA_ORIENTATION=-
MGCCTSKYSRLSETISLTDRILPLISPDTTKIRDLTTSERSQLDSLFNEFDESGKGFVDFDDLRAGLTTFGKHPSSHALHRIVKQTHLSSAPPNSICKKGFMLAICSRRSLLWEFLYTEYDTEKELEDELKKAKGGGKWRFGV